jgi:hypothetical protein
MTVTQARCSSRPMADSKPFKFLGCVFSDTPARLRNVNSKRVSSPNSCRRLPVSLRR